MFIEFFVADLCFDFLKVNTGPVAEAYVGGGS